MAAKKLPLQGLPQWPTKLPSRSKQQEQTKLIYYRYIDYRSKSPLNSNIKKLFNKKLSSHGGIKYSDKELAYAKLISDTLISGDELIGQQEIIQPFEKTQSYGSTDVGDISWNVPTAGFRASSWVPGTAAHSWQAVASGGTSIGLKGAELAAKTLASTAIELYENPNLINQAKREHEINIGEDFNYKHVLGSRKPPLEYRK